MVEVEELMGRTTVIWKVCEVCGALGPWTWRSDGGGKMRMLCCGALRSQVAEAAWAWSALAIEWRARPGARSGGGPIHVLEHGP